MTRMRSIILGADAPAPRVAPTKPAAKKPPVAGTKRVLTKRKNRLSSKDLLNDRM